MQFRQFALNDLQRAVELDDKLWDAQLLIGKLQALPLGDAQRRPAGAVTKVVDAEDATPEQKAEALALRSAVQSDEEKQLDDLNRAVELQPEKPDYLRLRAEYLLQRRRSMTRRWPTSTRRSKLEPDHAATQRAARHDPAGLEKYDDALASFDQASELDARSAALPYQHRGELYRQKGDLEKAVEQLTKALELAPDNVATLLVRAGVYYELKQTDKALEDIEQAIRVAAAAGRSRT